jgi:hypothetical protein
MDITSPFFVVPVIVVVFFSCILWATGGRPEGPEHEHEEAGGHA